MSKVSNYVKALNGGANVTAADDELKEQFSKVTGKRPISIYLLYLFLCSNPIHYILFNIIIYIAPDDVVLKL